jgi:NADH dehydrogenase (ubiquinone) Fe-S protein 1
VPPPGASREDWKIVRAISEALGSPLPYDDVLSLRDRMWEISPSLVRYDVTEPTSTAVALAGLKNIANATAKAKVTGAPLIKPISNFYQTDPISRAWVSLSYLIVMIADYTMQFCDYGPVHSGVCPG